MEELTDIDPYLTAKNHRSLRQFWKVFLGFDILKTGLLFCDHRKRYSFKKNSLLKEYLEAHCKGWVRDHEDKYTINYIAIVLLADFKEKNLIDSSHRRSVYITPQLSSVFKERLTLLTLREQIKKNLEHDQEEFTEDWLFSCMHQHESLIWQFTNYHSFISRRCCPYFDKLSYDSKLAEIEYARNYYKIYGYGPYFDSLMGYF